MLDECNYPDEGSLNKITAWSDFTNWAGLMSLVKENWNYRDTCWSQDGNKYFLHTGGWSGNEDVIDHLQNNALFWLSCWEQSKRGGHYIFVIPIIKK